jgi:hypothetical protein
MALTLSDPGTERFLEGKSAHTKYLYNCFIDTFSELGDISLHAAKTMIGISDGEKRIAWITQLGKNFIHVVLPFDRPYEDNLCFGKVAQVPGTKQFNHHLRILQAEDLNDEVKKFLLLALGRAMPAEE